METGERIITYWLCPAEPARSELAAIIDELAARFDAPVFEPHMTLFVTSAEENPSAIVRKVAQGTRPYRLTVRSVDYSDKFTQTLFVQFEPDLQLSQFSEDLRRAAAAPNDYELNPHLSLIYKEMDSETKRQVASSIALPFAGVTFDRLKAVISPAKIGSREDVAVWRVVAEQELTG
jgi:hypothetical protein